MKTCTDNRDGVRNRANAVTVSMNKIERDELRESAEEAGMSMSCFARIAIRKYMKERKR